MITNPYIGQSEPEEVSVEIPVDLESNVYRKSAGLPLLPSTSGQSWIDTAGKGSLRSQGLVVESKIASEIPEVQANRPSKTFSQTLAPITNELTPSSTFRQTPVGPKGSLPRPNQSTTRIANPARQPKVGNLLEPKHVGIAKNPILNTPVTSIPTPTVKKEMNMFEQRATSIKNKPKERILQTANKAKYTLKLIQITPTTYRIDICDRFALGSKPKASTGVLTKQQAISEFARLKGEQKKRTL